MSHLANILLGYIQLGTTLNTPFLPPIQYATWFPTIRYSIALNSLFATYPVCYLVTYNQVQQHIELFMSHLTNMLLDYLHLSTTLHRTIYLPPNQYTTRLPTIRYNIAQNSLSDTHLQGTYSTTCSYCKQFLSTICDRKRVSFDTRISCKDRKLGMQCDQILEKFAILANF